MISVESKPIPIDFNIDRILLNNEKVVIPKFVKAIVRLAKVITQRKEKLIVIYPNYKCEYIPIILISSYFHFVHEKKSRTGFKLLIVTNSENTISTYQKLCNSFGTPFVDFIYSGYLSKNEYRRLKPEGSTRGSMSGKILLEQSNVFIVRPSSLCDVLDHKFDLAIVEDCQKFFSKRYYNNMKKLVESKIPILGIMTLPDFNVATKYKDIFQFKIFGWDEELLRKDSQTFNDIYATSKTETHFPTIKGIEIPIDDYHQSLNFIWSAYRKSHRTRLRLVDNDVNITRIFIELRKIIQNISSLAFPYQILCDVQTEFGYVPLDKRIIITRGIINQISKKTNEILELEKILDMCDNILKFKPTKQKFYEEYLGENVVRFVALPDFITEVCMKRHFAKSSLNTVNPETPNQITKKRLILNNLTGKLDDDYKIIKSIKTEQLEVLTYTHEKEFLERIIRNKDNLKQLLGLRSHVLEELRISNYS
jgi:hypothetical protein